MDFGYKWESSPVPAGRSEYGLPKVQYLHYVVAISEEGDRYAHFHGEMSEDPECPPATARILRLALNRQPDPRRDQRWEQTDPVDGSPAYLRDQEDEERVAAMEDELMGRFDALESSFRN